MRWWTCGMRTVRIWRVSARCWASFVDCVWHNSTREQKCASRDCSETDHQWIVRWLRWFDRTDRVVSLAVEHRIDGRSRIEHIHFLVWNDRDLSTNRNSKWSILHRCSVRPTTHKFLCGGTTGARCWCWVCWGIPRQGWSACSLLEHEQNYKTKRAHLYPSTYSIGFLPGVDAFERGAVVLVVDTRWRFTGFYSGEERRRWAEESREREREANLRSVRR